MNIFKKIDQRWYWIAFALMVIFCRWALASRPDLIEHYYSRGLFTWIRVLIDYTIAKFPIPWIYMIILAIIAYLANKWRTRKDNKKNWKEQLPGFVLSILTFIGLIISAFLLLWGFNYSRMPLESQLQIQPDRLSEEALQEELDIVTKQLIRFREAIPNADTNALDQQYLVRHLRDTIQDLVEANLEALGYPTPGRPVCRYLRPKGSLLRISTAGFYMPFTGECHVDPALHPVQLPFVIAHEFNHAYGFTDEGTCNFLAYLTCLRSKNPFIRYCGQYGYWAYLRGNYGRGRGEAYRDYLRSLPKGIRADQIAVYEQMQQYPDILPDLRDLIYGSYLKAQGISEGLQNYSRIILLAHAWRKKQEKEQSE